MNCAYLSVHIHVHYAINVAFSNNKGETPVHCAAYNASDNSSLMKHLMDVCNKNSTLDLQDILSLHEEEARVRCLVES